MSAWPLELIFAACFGAVIWFVILGVLARWRRTRRTVSTTTFSVAALPSVLRVGDEIVVNGQARRISAVNGTTVTLEAPR